VEAKQLGGPVTRDMAMNFILSWELTSNGRAVHHGVLRRFCEYLSIYDTQTEALDIRALPRSRVIPPPRILNDAELGLLIDASSRVSPDAPLRGLTLKVLIGLLASTGLRSGEALRLDRNDVDFAAGVLHIRKTKFRKDRLVPVHTTTMAALDAYAQHRDATFPVPKDSAFFLSLRRSRLSSAGLYRAFGLACEFAGFDNFETLRPHDLRHRFVVTRLARWHREKADVQALLPLLATYLGHARYTDTAYYVTGTPELLAMAAERAFTVGDIP
jgi:integrase